MIQSSRMNYYAAQPQLMGKLLEVSMAVKKSGLDPKLLHLVDIRVSQINGCAFCLDMHSKEAKIDGERELRIYMLPVWRESNLYDERERSALEWAEAVTHLGQHGVPDAVWKHVRVHFSDAEITQLTMAIALINAWNRLAISFHSVPGSLDKQYGLEKAGLH